MGLPQAIRIIGRSLLDLTLKPSSPPRTLRGPPKAPVARLDPGKKGPTRRACRCQCAERGEARQAPAVAEAEVNLGFRCMQWMKVRCSWCEQAICPRTACWPWTVGLQTDPKDLQFRLEGIKMNRCSLHEAPRGSQRLAGDTPQQGLHGWHQCLACSRGLLVKQPPNFDDGGRRPRHPASASLPFSCCRPLCPSFVPSGGEREDVGGRRPLDPWDGHTEQPAVVRRGALPRLHPRGHI